MLPRHHWYVFSALDKQEGSDNVVRARKTGVRPQEPSASSSMLVQGASGSHTDQRQQNVLGLYIAHPSSLPTMSSPHLASTATPASAVLAAPVTSHTKTPLRDPITSLHAEVTNPKLRIGFMEQNWVPKGEIEERVRAWLGQEWQGRSSVRGLSRQCSRRGIGSVKD